MENRRRAFYCKFNNVQCHEAFNVRLNNTHSDFDDLTVETVQHNSNIPHICRGISSVVPEKERLPLQRVKNQSL